MPGDRIYDIQMFADRPGQEIQVRHDEIPQAQGESKEVVEGLGKIPVSRALRNRLVELVVDLE